MLLNGIPFLKKYFYIRFNFLKYNEINLMHNVWTRLQFINFHEAKKGFMFDTNFNISFFIINLFFSKKRILI